MKQLFLPIFCVLMTLGVGIAMAQTGYPVFYTEENPTYGNLGVPPIVFPPEPTACAPDDQTCIDNYLEEISEQLDASMRSQQPPSPVYSFKSGECALNTEDCGALEEQWKNWNVRARQGGLDFAQDTSPAQEDLDCNNELLNAGWWMDYAYHCQNLK